MGTGPATHVVRTFMDITRIMNVCAFFIFMDLSKAFDSLVRETVLGWPEHLTPEQRRDHLRQAGVEDNALDDMLALIDGQKPALEAAGIPSHVRAMLLSLHTGA